MNEDEDLKSTSKGLLQKVLINTQHVQHESFSFSANTDRLSGSYFSKPCELLAQLLIGKTLVRRLPSGEILKGKIVETESYLGIEDKASHSYAGKKTERNLPMFMSPGTCYVYFIYGMYFCFNISSFEEGSAVLIRALEPLEGLSVMRNLRMNRNNKLIKDKDLCNGPSKLCQAMMIEKDTINKEHLGISENIWLENGPHIDSSVIVKCKRIGIKASAEEWVSTPLRYYLRGSNCVSIKDKDVEMLMKM